MLLRAELFIDTLTYQCPSSGSAVTDLHRGGTLTSTAVGSQRVRVVISLLGRRFVTRPVSAQLPSPVRESFQLERRLPLNSTDLDEEVAYLEVITVDGRRRAVVATFETSALALLFADGAHHQRLQQHLDLVLEPSEACGFGVVPRLLVTVAASVLTEYGSSAPRGVRPPPPRSLPRRRNVSAATRSEQTFAWRHLDTALLWRTPGAAPSLCPPTMSGTVSVPIVAHISHKRSAKQQRASSPRRTACQRRRVSRSLSVARRVKNARDLPSPQLRSWSLHHLPTTATCPCPNHRATAERENTLHHCRNHCLVCAAYVRRFQKPYQPHYVHCISRRDGYPNQSVFSCPDCVGKTACCC